MTTTMHFGPEWMRTKQQTSARPHPPSPPPVISTATHTGVPVPPGATSYSALVTPPPPPPQDKGDIAHPFKYPRAEMLRIWKEGGGCGPLPIEVERWEGVVREHAGEPVGMKEMSEVEKKLFAASLNSELRRRQSLDYIGQGERPKLHHSVSSTGSPLRESFPGLMGRRRRGDSTGADQPPLTLLPRKQSWSSAHAPLPSPGLSSPRTRMGGGMHTPGFDGILNGGDHWSGNKRRVSSGGSFMHRGDLETDAPRDEKALEIKEEEEESSQLLKPDRLSEDNSSHASSSSPSAPSINPPGSDLNEMENVMNDLSVNSRPNSGNHVAGMGLEAGTLGSAPTDLSILASIEWSYLDFSGNIQGPFRADTMQTWYDQQYFTDDLLMKRTHIDLDWTSVADLKRRVQGDKMFLSPLSDAPVPPGLVRRAPEPPFDPLAQGAGQILQNSHVFDSPYQPTPQHSARNATLDSYLNNTSTSSDSPSSSFGGGFGRPSDSPDPLAVGGRISAHAINTDMHYSGRTGPGGFVAGSNPAMPFMARRGFNDASPDPAFGTRGSYGDMTPGRSSLYDAPGFNNNAGVTSIPWQSTVNNGQPFDTLNQGASNPNGMYASNGQTTPHGVAELPFGATAPFAKGSSFNTFRTASSQDGSAGAAGQPSPSYGAPGSQREFSRLLGRDPLGRSMGLRDEPEMNNSSTQNQSPTLQYATHQPQHQHSLPPISTALGQPFQSAPISPLVSSQQARHLQMQMPARPVVSQSPWGTPTDQTSRSRPFDAQHPTVNNTVVRPLTTPSQTSPWPRGQAGTQPAMADAQVPVDDGWGELTDEPQSLTFNHVNQHNQLQQGFTEGVTLSGAAGMDSPAAQAIPPSADQGASFDAPISSSPVATRDDAPRKAPVSKRQTNTMPPQAITSEPSQPLPAAGGVKSPPSGPSTPTPKPAWSTEEEAKKTKPSGLSMGLREIQDAEKRRKDVQKAADKEKERATRATAQVPTEDGQTFTATWGLPTSQVGTRPIGTNAAKESTGSAASPASPSNAAAWTNAGKTPATKKTMKEIQEEEERRKKLVAREKETVAQAAKRAYAESATKSTPSSHPALGGAWTTVGSSGKPSTPGATSAAVRPSMSTQTSSSTVSSPALALRSANGIPAGVSAPPPRSPKVVKPAVAPKVEEEPTPPSLEFMKWMRDSLRGLKSSVQFEDLAQMLLSFPLDPDPSTVEVIVEMVYGASTTVDGRRFADEFIAKRKVDAASRPKGTAGSVSNGKPASLADIVKTQPKPASSEWGYKVVKKKGKNGRA